MPHSIRHRCERSHQTSCLALASAAFFIVAISACERSNDTLREDQRDQLVIEWRDKALHSVRLNDREFHQDGPPPTSAALSKALVGKAPREIIIDVDAKAPWSAVHPLLRAMLAAGVYRLHFADHTGATIIIRSKTSESENRQKPPKMPVKIHLHQRNNGVPQVVIDNTPGAPVTADNPAALRKRFRNLLHTREHQTGLFDRDAPVLLTADDDVRWQYLAAVIRAAHAAGYTHIYLRRLLPPDFGSTTIRSSS